MGSPTPPLLYHAPQGSVLTNIGLNEADLGGTLGVV